MNKTVSIFMQFVLGIPGGLVKPILDTLWTRLCCLLLPKS